MSNNNNNNDESVHFMDSDFAVTVRNHFFQNDHANGFAALDICQVFTNDYYGQGLEELTENKENIDPNCYGQVMESLMENVWQYYAECVVEGDPLIGLRYITNPDDLNNYIVGNADTLYLQFRDYQCFLWYMHLHGRMCSDPELKEYINSECDGIVCLLALMKDIEMTLVYTRIESEEFKEKMRGLFAQRNKKLI